MKTTDISNVAATIVRGIGYGIGGAVIVSLAGFGIIWTTLNNRMNDVSAAQTEQIAILTSVSKDLGAINQNMENLVAVNTFNELKFNVSPFLADGLIDRLEAIESHSELVAMSGGGAIAWANYGALVNFGVQGDVEALAKNTTRPALVFYDPQTETLSQIDLPVFDMKPQVGDLQ